MFRPILSLLVTVALGMLPAHAADPPRVTLTTSMGDVVIELAPDKAPVTVANFLAYVKDGFYDGTVFHRVIPGFMVQGGGFGTDFGKKETRDPVRNEADNGLVNARGTVAMARTGAPHSATAQFFVNLVDNDFLNHRAKDQAGWGYTVFARVVDGMDVVDSIAKVPTGTRGSYRDVPQTDVVINTARIQEPVQ